MATECGPRFPDILEQPFALTLWTYYQIAERDRILALRKRIELTDEAVLTALAFNEPQKLAIEQQAARDAARSAPKKDDAEWRERATRLVAAIEDGQVLADA